MTDALETTIVQVFAEVYREHNPAENLPELKTDSVLMETGLDSLGFALLVIRLEETLGYDPFLLSKEPYYPRTFGDFVAFYQSNQPHDLR